MNTQQLHVYPLEMILISVIEQLLLDFLKSLK